MTCATCRYAKPGTFNDLYCVNDDSPHCTDYIPGIGCEFWEGMDDGATQA